MKQALTFITFLLLLLPVWKDCTSRKPVSMGYDIEVIDTLDVSYNEIDVVSADNNMNIVDTMPKQTAFDNFLKIFEWDESCQSGYRQVWSGIDFFKREKDETKNIENEAKDTEDERINNIKDIFLIFIFCGLLFSFTIYFLISTALAVFLFTKKRKTFIWLSGVNFFVIIWAYISFFYFANNFYQIKFGFYLLIINSLLIFLSNFLCKKR